jgi:hypothetical protein
MDETTKDDVARMIDEGIYPSLPDIQLQRTKRHTYPERRKTKKLGKSRIDKLPDNFKFDKFLRSHKSMQEVMPSAPHNTSQYLIANHTRESIIPIVSLFSEYTIDEDQNIFIEELLNDEICITGGSMRKIICNEYNICIHEIIETQRKIIESLDQQKQERRTI